MAKYRREAHSAPQLLRAAIIFVKTSSPAPGSNADSRSQANARLLPPTFQVIYKVEQQNWGSPSPNDTFVVYILNTPRVVRKSEIVLWLSNIFGPEKTTAGTFANRLLEHCVSFVTEW